MFTLSTNIELPIAHRLPGAYSGLCVGNVSRDEKEVFPKDDLGMVHGHNYIITIDVSTDKMNEDFMVMDFKKVKKIIHNEMDKYDHSLILKEGDALIDFYKSEYAKRDIDINKTRLFIWKTAPTAEYMAYKWFRTFVKRFIDEGIELTKLVVTVEETSHNKVSYTEDYNEMIYNNAEYTED